jgi:hypothetical protein
MLTLWTRIAFSVVGKDAGINPVTFYPVSPNPASVGSTGRTTNPQTAQLVSMLERVQHSMRLVMTQTAFYFTRPWKYCIVVKLPKQREGQMDFSETYLSNCMSRTISWFRLKPNPSILRMNSSSLAKHPKSFSTVHLI